MGKRREEGGGPSTLLLHQGGALHLQAHDQQVWPFIAIQKEKGREEEEKEEVFHKKKGMITYLQTLEHRSSGSRRIVKTTTEPISTSFCKLNFPLIDKTTSYFV